MANEDSIKNEITILLTFSKVSRVGNYHTNSRNWTKIEYVRDFLSVLFACMFEEDPSKIKLLSPGQKFPNNMSTGPFGSLGNINSDQICPKT